MGKPVLRVILSAAAVLFSLNLLLFNYSQHVILPLLGALFLLAALLGLGDGVAWLFRARAAGVMEKAALGLMAAAAYFYLVCFLGILNPLTVWLFFAVSLASGALGWLVREGKRESWESLHRFFSRPLVEYSPFLLPLVYAALPPTFYDSLVYHLGIPNLYLQSGGFVPTPWFVFANTFIYYEISLIPAVFLGDQVPRLFHFLLGTLFVLAVADEAVESWGVRKRLNLVLALSSLPMTLFLLTTCKNDLAGAIFVFLAIMRYRRGDWKLSAVFWGFAVGIKYSNLLPLALFMLVAFKPWRKADLKKLALMGLVVVLAVTPLLVKNFRFTGNPVFPFLNGAFPSANWDAGLFSGFQREVGVMVHSPAEALRLPYDLSFFNHGYGGLVGPLFLVFLPFLLLGPVREKQWLLWALLVLAAVPFFTSSLRYVFAVFVVLAIFAVRAFEASATKLLRTLFPLLISMNFIMGFAMLEKFYQAHLLLGGACSSEQYRERFFPTYPAFDHVNRQTPPGAKVLLVGEARNFYLKRPYRLSSAHDRCIVKKYLGAAGDANSFIAAVRADGFSYLLVSFSELERLQAAYGILTAAEKEKLLLFLRAMTPEFRQGALAVYGTD
jgi:hypothetical protein